MIRSESISCKLLPVVRKWRKSVRDFEYERPRSMDPVFDSVCALYAFDNLDCNCDIRHEVSDSVVLIDFEEFSWSISKVKSDSMRDWHKDNDRFRVRKIRKRINETVCLKGHPMSPENTLLHNGAKTCKTCNKLYAREWRRKQRERKGLEA